MSRRRNLKLLAAAAVGCAVAVAGAAPAPAADPPCSPSKPGRGGIQRPPQGGPWSYGLVRPKRLAGQVAIVHWVEIGRSAPPLRDRSPKDGVPDYVQATLDAVEAALAQYTGPPWNFRSPPCDEGGPDRRIDVYIVRGGGALGRTIRPRDGAGGSFLLLSDDLEQPGTTTAARYGLLGMTAAHESAHLVQYAYAPQGMPRWIAEGTAQLMAFHARGIGNWKTFNRLFVEVERRWWKEPWRSFFDAGLYCDTCYGGNSFWQFAFPLPLEVSGDTPQLRLVQRLYEALRSGSPTRTGVTRVNGAIKAELLGYIASLRRDGLIAQESVDAVRAASAADVAQLLLAGECTVMYGTRLPAHWGVQERPVVGDLSFTGDPIEVRGKVAGYSCHWLRLRSETPVTVSWAFETASSVVPTVWLTRYGTEGPTGARPSSELFRSSDGRSASGGPLDTYAFDPATAPGDEIIVTLASASERPVGYRVRLTPRT